MKIHGVGTDIVMCSRIAKAWKNHGLNFAKRILNNLEIENFNKLKHKQIAYIASRFAAKEAIVKSLGTGFNDHILLTQIYIENNKMGKPLVRFIAQTKQFVKNLGKLNIQLSIADEKEYVIAFAIAMKE